MKRLRLAGIIVWVGLLLLGQYAILQAAMFTVDSREDSGDRTLRWAIEQANATIGEDTINFNLSNSITVFSNLIISYPVVIDGSGTTVGSTGSDIFVFLPGSDGSTIKDLAIVNGYSGIVIFSNNNRIIGCTIGTDWASASGRGNVLGVYVEGWDNEIGGARSSDRNIISGNLGWGITSSGATCLRVRGNYIGTTNDGTAALANGNGVSLSDGTIQSMIGGNRNEGEGNLISGNTQFGISIDLAATRGNSICGNVIGLNADQTTTIPNVHGVWIAGSSGNFIGLPLDGYGNIIAGNSSDGIYVEGTSRQNVIQNNFIGISSNSTVFSNGTGIFLYGAYNLLGGTAAGEKNIICGINYGIQIRSTNAIGNTVVGNWIGVLSDGSQPAEQFTHSIYLDSGASGNFIGMKSIGQGNLIAKGTNGITVNGATTNQNGLFGNTICAFSGTGIYLTSGGNDGKIAPVITFADVALVSGTAAENNYIEVFRSDRGAGEHGGSLKFVGWAEANGSGIWSLVPSGLVGGDYVCATASDSNNNTSGFSSNALVTGPTPTSTSTPSSTPTHTPTLTISSTFTVSPTITSTKTLTPTPTISPTLTISSTFTASPTVTLTATSTPTNALSGIDLKGKIALAFPNPGRDKVKFLMHLDQAADVKIIIYNLSGERISELKKILSPGRGQVVVWKCDQVATGIYLARIFMQGKEVEKIKIAVVR